MFTSCTVRCSRDADKSCLRDAVVARGYDRLYRVKQALQNK